MELKYLVYLRYFVSIFMISRESIKGISNIIFRRKLRLDHIFVGKVESHQDRKIAKASMKVEFFCLSKKLCLPFLLGPFMALRLLFMVESIPNTTYT